MRRFRRPDTRFQLPPAKGRRPTCIGGASLGDYLKRRSAYDPAGGGRTRAARIALAARTLAVLAVLAILAWLGYNSYLALVFLAD